MCSQGLPTLVQNLSRLQQPCSQSWRRASKVHKRRRLQHPEAKAVQQGVVPGGVEKELFSVASPRFEIVNKSCMLPFPSINLLFRNLFTSKSGEANQRVQEAMGNYRRSSIQVLWPQIQSVAKMCGSVQWCHPCRKSKPNIMLNCWLRKLK